MSRTSLKLLNKDKILDEGVSLLMEHGYHGTGLQQILDRVGVPKGSFYNYFGSKEEFGGEVIRHYIEPFITLLDRHLSVSDRSAALALRAYFDELIGELERRSYKGGCLLGNLMGEVGDTSDHCRAALQEAVHRYRDKLCEGISRGQREGDFRTDRTAEDLADFLTDAWQGALLRMKIEQSTRPLKTCCNHLLGELFRS
ncbi:MAG: TetR family transcriptional regulator [Methylococcaceae bacterium]|nr:TetR family transcriptional regulator [Methylococcaceae bacterium]